MSQSSSEVVERLRRVLERAQGKGPEGVDRERQAAERRRWEAELRTRELRATWNVPKRHALAEARREGPWGEKLAAVEARLGNGLMIGLVGPRATGKTQMGVELMKRVTASGRQALFRTAMELLMRFKRCYQPDATESELDVLRAHRRPSLLVIDELARRAETDWENNMLFELLNHRYGDVSDTVLIGSLSAADLESSLGPSIASRMREGGGIIECAWAPFR